MHRIGKRFSFSASHIIGGLPDDHPCARLHGHNYEVEVSLQSPALDTAGFVRDFRELSALKDFIDATLDHRHLNDVLGHDSTTTEVIGGVALRLVQGALAGSRRRPRQRDAALLGRSTGRERSRSASARSSGLPSRAKAR